MENLGDAMSKMMNKFLKKVGTCPMCNGDLLAWKGKNKDGTERCAPTCVACGYSDLKRKADLETRQIYEKSLKARTINLFKNGSMLADKNLFNKTFGNYKLLDEESTLAKQKADEFIACVLNNKPRHFVLTGKSGVGKSHLSMAISWDVIERSNYDKKVLFINYQELLSELKKAFKDDVMYKLLHQSLLQDIKTVDLVILDDLGAELGGSVDYNATTFNNDILYSILEARQEKALVVNSNLNSEEMNAAYGNRIVSRIMNNSQGFLMRNKSSKDRRVVGVGEAS